MDILEPEKRMRGCLLGLAVGDAVGAAYEFLPPDKINPAEIDMIGGGAFNLKPGQYTDDTSMALCLAESLLECKGTDCDDQAAKYVRWLDEGYMSSTGECFDIGNNTRQALTDYKRQGKKVFDLPDDDHQGNGCIMRLAPAVLYYYDKGLRAVLKNCRQSAITTHRNKQAKEVCALFGKMLYRLLSGVSKDKFFSEFQRFVKDKKELNARGHMKRSLECALWAFCHTDGFEQGVKAVISLGYDTDSNAAIYGQLAGACYGVDAIPEKWLNTLQDRRSIDVLAKRLLGKEDAAQIDDEKYSETQNSNIIVFPLEQQIFLVDAYVAGTTHIAEIDKIEQGIIEGTRLKFVREANNPHDALAIMIKDPEGNKLGYVPKQKNEILSRLMDAGKLIYCKVNKKERVGNWLKVTIQIFMEG